jgi:transcriptional regulator with XRE-family HTH domain
MDIKKVFGENLKSVRHEKGLTQETLEALTGFDRSYLGGIERGVRNPSLNAIGVLADSLDVSPERFFEGYRKDLKKPEPQP